MGRNKEVVLEEGSQNIDIKDPDSISQAPLLHFTRIDTEVSDRYLSATLLR